MAGKKIHLKMITPTEVKVDLAVDMIIMRCTNGDMGVLPGHEPRSAELCYGILRILDEGDERIIAVYGGLAVIQNDVVTVLTTGAEWPEEIDAARAKEDREHMEQRIREKTDDIEIQNDQLLLRRALVQIEVSASSVTDSEE